MKATKEKEDWSGLEDNIQVRWRLMSHGVVRIQRNVHRKDYLLQKTKDGVNESWIRGEGKERKQSSCNRLILKLKAN